MVQAVDGVVTVPVHAAVDRAAAEGQHELGTLHLFVAPDDALHGLHRGVAADDEDRALPGRRPRLDSVLVHVEAGGHQGPELDGAASGTEPQHPEALRAGPVQELLPEAAEGLMTFGGCVAEEFRGLPAPGLRLASLRSPVRRSCPLGVFRCREIRRTSVSLSGSSWVRVPTAAPSARPCIAG